ncbi:MAG TPA: CPBP family intramembrane glutamic endopeptidase [Anaerolineales bacterium]|nr:CPBP family intramembrane glutamic endopeptidase [Anaerolineales bacterium]
MRTSQPKFPWLYLLLAYSLAWVFWLPVVWTRQDYQKSPLLLALVLVGTFGPGIAGIILVYREFGKEGRRDYWHRVFDFRRISFKWYALILLLFPSMHLISIAANSWMGGIPPQFEFIKEAIAMPIGIPVVVILYLLQAGLEELGWRGYMLDRLQVIWKPLTASLVLGIFHAFWHLPMFWVVGTNQSRWLNVPDFTLFIAFVLASSIYTTWCYNENRRSILAAALLHTMGNLSLDTFMLSGGGENIFNMVFVLGAVIVAIAWTLPPWEQRQVTSI